MKTLVKQIFFFFFFSFVFFVVVLFWFFLPLRHPVFGESFDVKMQKYFVSFKISLSISLREGVGMGCCFGGVFNMFYV